MPDCAKFELGGCMTDPDGFCIYCGRPMTPTTKRRRRVVSHPPDTVDP